MRRRGAAHLTVVLGEPARAGELRSALEIHGVDHAAIIAGVGAIRRSLVLGENDFVVVCIAIDRPTLARHGAALRRLLADHRCFPTKVRTVGLLNDLGLTRDAAELGCDVYVDDSARAAEAIHLLENDARLRSPEPRPAAASRWTIRGRWMFGSPALPAELNGLVAVEPCRSAARGAGDAGRDLRSHRVEGSGEEFGGQRGPH